MAKMLATGAMMAFVFITSEPVYAGGILVLLIFAIMLVKNLGTDTETTSYVNKTIAGKKGMTYYVRVVPVSVVNGKTYVGVQNATHSVKIK